MRVFVTGLILVFTLVSHAADPLTEAGERFLQEQKIQRQLQQLQNRQDDFQPTQSYTDIPDDDTCFDVHLIKVAGNTLLSYKEINIVVSKYKDQCLGKLAINQLMQELTGVYINKGYVTSRVYIPPQDLRTGILELIVIEGYVESVSINNNSAADRRKLWWAMSPAWGRHLRLPEIEQALDQINSVQSAGAVMKLWPGQETGATHVQIINKPNDELRGDIGFSNDGQDDTGKYRTRLSIYADNIIGINDAISTSIITSTNTNALTLSLNVPFRRWGFGVSHSYSEYLNILPENTDLFGQSNTSTLSSDYLIYRDQSFRINAIASLTHRYSERHLLGVRLEPQRQVPARIALNVSRNNSWGYYSAEVGHVHGTRLLGADEDQAGIPTEAPHTQFQKQDIRLVVGAPIGIASYQLTIAGQHTDTALYSSEQIHLGDQSSVRGTETTFASGDKGFYTQNTVTFPGRTLVARYFVNSTWLAAYNVRFFTDYGRVWRNYDAAPEYGASMGLGVSARYGRFNLDISYATLVSSGDDYTGDEFLSISLGAKAF